MIKLTLKHKYNQKIIRSDHDSLRIIFMKSSKHFYIMFVDDVQRKILFTLSTLTLRNKAFNKRFNSEKHIVGLIHKHSQFIQKIINKKRIILNVKYMSYTPKIKRIFSIIESIRQ